MKIPLPRNVIPLGPDPVRPASGRDKHVKALAIVSRHADNAAEHLMPYESVAKAIFVKANGLLAYYKATGLPKRGC